MGKRNWVGGFILISLGTLFFINNFIEIKIEYLWPLVLIAVGILLLFQKKQPPEE